MKEIIETGKTLDEALEKACAQLGIDKSEAQYEVLEMPSKKILGLLGGSLAKVKVTYEEPQLEPIDKVVAYLKIMLDTMKIGEYHIEVTPKDKEYVVNISGDDLGVVIGRRSETLDAIQYLCSLLLNKGSGNEYTRLTLDIGNYREKRQKTLQILARKTGIQVAKSGRSVTLEPMNPYERRIIHATVQEVRGAVSSSTGEEPNRRVVISPDKDYRRGPSEGGNNDRRGNDRNDRNRRNGPRVSPRDEKAVTNNRFKDEASYSRLKEELNKNRKPVSDLPDTALYGRLDQKD